MKILSLGWGVQSFTLAAMAALDEIEKPAAAIHADTTMRQAGLMRLPNAGRRGWRSGG